MKLNKWRIKNKIVLFPKEWDKTVVMKWLNADYIRVCPVCSKIDVSYDHFNSCNEALALSNKKIFYSTTFK